MSSERCEFPKAALLGSMGGGLWSPWAGTSMEFGIHHENERKSNWIELKKLPVKNRPNKQKIEKKV